MNSRRSLSASLRGTLSDERTRAAFARLDEARIKDLATRIVAEDSYGEAGHLIAALARMGLGPADVRTHIEHQLVCAWREARHQMGKISPSAVREHLHFEGIEQALETAGAPTVIVTPMTLGLHDAMTAVTTFVERYFPGRRHIVYGEGMDGTELTDPAMWACWAGRGKAAARCIIEALEDNAIFFTYADFVYEGHPALSVPMFGAPFAISAGFVSFASRPGTMLLPCLLELDGEALKCRFFEASCLDRRQREGVSRSEVREAVGLLVAEMLEDLIREAGAHWLLLPTLTFEAPQRTSEPAQRPSSMHSPV